MQNLSGFSPLPHRRWLIGALFPLFLAACATAPSAQEPAPAPDATQIGPGELGETEIEANTVQGEDEMLARTRTLADMLSRLPGVRVSERGGNIVVRVRNAASFLAGEDPLVLIDGMIYNGALGAIDPFAIESITVLKNADETAVYGSRGGNGVILIRTKTYE